MRKTQGATRRTVIAVAGLVTAFPLVVASGQAKAAGGVTQANAKYQTKPNGAAQCSKCNYFLPGANATQNGQCKVVAGSISPNGWCQLFAKKQGT